jgi:3-phosphoshikimate 1-carboxyvinyltransferase
MEVTVRPGKLAGSVRVPASKSHTIRALIIASLAPGESRVEAPLDSADARSCVACCRAFGAEIDDSSTEVWRVRGTGGRPAVPENVIDVGNSGTTLYIAMATASLVDGYTVFTGDEQIRRRPARNLLGALRDLGATAHDTRGNGCAPLVIGGPLRGGRTAIACPTSQYLSALLLAAPLGQGTSEIEVTELNEQPYVEMTLDWLDRQQISYERRGLTWFRVPGGQAYKPFARPVPGDFSSATFFFAAAAVTGNAVTVQGLNPNDSQGDKEVLGLLERMGCRVTWRDTSVTVEGGSLRGIDVDLNAMPDALPALAVAACFAEGTTRIGNVPQARLKETDRITVMRQELARMGASIEEKPDGLVIRGSRLAGARVDGHGDHRVVMALAVAALGARGETTVTTAEAAAVTFPDFFKLLEGLRA